MPTKRQKTRKKTGNVFQRYGVGKVDIIRNIIVNIITFPIRAVVWFLTNSAELFLSAPLVRHKSRKK